VARPLSTLTGVSSGRMTAAPYALQHTGSATSASAFACLQDACGKPHACCFWTVQAHVRGMGTTGMLLAGGRWLSITQLGARRHVPSTATTHRCHPQVRTPQDMHLYVHSASGNHSCCLCERPEPPYLKSEPNFSLM
jgi:hypothetical protein